jgi:hypothetical protein
MTDDDTTPEQRDAERALDEAIRNAHYAFGGRGMPAGWVVCCGAVGTDDISDYSSVNLMFPPGGLPWHHVLGLLRGGTLRFEADMESDL